MRDGLVHEAMRVVQRLSVEGVLALGGCTVAISELMPTCGRTPLNFLAGTRADTPICNDARTTVRFSPPTTTSFSIAIYDEGQLIDRVDCRNEWRRVSYGSRLTGLDCGITAQVNVNQIENDTIEFQHINLANAPSTLEEAAARNNGSMTLRLNRCIGQ